MLTKMWCKRAKSLSAFRPTWLESLAEYEQRIHRSRSPEQRRRHETSLTPRDRTPFQTSGYCYPCQSQVELEVDFRYAYPVDGRLQPNWRERLVCPGCRLNSRVRATLHLFEEVLGGNRQDPIYLTEQNTALHRWMSERYDQLTGSEFLGPHLRSGQVSEQGLRHEDLTRLSFGDDSLDHILSFDVLEHVPDYLAAARDCLRCLKPGGTLFFSVPFIVDTYSSLVRARIDADGRIEHLHPPEYHGDPVNAEGCLCYYHFGWELLDQLRELGYGEVGAYDYWSAEHGYLGRNTLIFVARKPD
ncbi:class I SAM-dependent methyltransferase [Thiocystis violacea]|uniref:class I SAM-dependent methyltransferase n=1 Tax=Thiocystis violacea TaxID=13725 RepID=UPI0019070F77|nr:class I SAM-dependent methyltransferase [Thiocystis violacea]MBK1720169.1 hypothetical protein [Thiocystis violacea]